VTAPPRPLALLSGNLLAGGIGRSRTETRFEPLLRLAAELRPDVAAFQEALYWDEDDHRLLHEAERLLGMRGLLGISPRTRMHTVVFVRPPLRVTAHRVYCGGIWHHSATRAVIAWDTDQTSEAGRITLVNAHLSPRSPARRILEAEELTDLAIPGNLTLLAADTNTPDRHTDLSTATARELVRDAHPGTRTPDTTPIDRLLRAGFLDLADLHGAPRPARTTGYWPGKPIASRPDRLLATPAAANLLEAFDVIDTSELRALSDHLWLLGRFRVRIPRPAPAHADGRQNAVC
jgi:endonuclease/exonuclease/phosphatase family metal-dependent hydrolase